MARKSASSFEVVQIGEVQPKIEPPPHLSQDEKRLFESIVQSVSPIHFQKSDSQLLAAYVQSCFLVSLAYESAIESPGHLRNWEKAVKTMVLLGRQLRLAPLGRVDPRTLERAYEGRSYRTFPDLERIKQARDGTGPTRDWKAKR